MPKKSAIAIVAESKSGKSTSLGNIPELGIKGVDPKETLLINVKGKPLPYAGWEEDYNAIGFDKPPTTENYLESTDSGLIIKTMEYFSQNRPDIKNVIIDDFQYVIGDEFMATALKTGFEKFSRMGKNTYDILNTGLNLRSDMTFVILTHSEETRSGYKIKTIGKMLDEKITLEGLFTVILYARSIRDSSTKKVSKQFVTNNDGEYPAGSPFGMFKELYIPNDLGLVIETAKNFYSRKASTV